MKKTICILTILCTLFNTSLIYTIPTGDKAKKEQSLTIACSGSSYRSYNIHQETTHVKINIGCSGNNTSEVHIPSSVKKVSLEGSVSGNLHLTLYAQHTPKLDDNIRSSGNSQVRIIHPIRKYTYHLTALAAIGALAYYFTREK